MIWYVGDLHGYPDFYAEIDRKARLEGVSTIVQVGNTGIRWPGKCTVSLDSGERAIVNKDHPNCPIVHFFNKRQKRKIESPVWYTCGGNHDNWRHWNQLKYIQGLKNPTENGWVVYNNTVELAPGFFFVPRGKSVEIEGKRHLFFGGAESTDRHSRIENIDWWPEEAPTAQEYAKFHEALVTEKPDIVVTHDCPVFIIEKWGGRRFSAVSQTLARIHELSDHKPKTWYFGHHHRLQEWFYNETMFKCCGLHGQYWASGGYKGQVLPAHRMRLP